MPHPIAVVVTADHLSVAADECWVRGSVTLSLVRTVLTVLVPVTFPLQGNTLFIATVKLFSPTLLAVT